MFSYLNGKIEEIGAGTVTVDVGGVGFSCNASIQTLSRVEVGSVAKLYTYLNVREDALDLFGFASQAELNCFKTLTNVSGVGPKVGLSILSELAPEQLAIAISAGDFKALTRASGVGPKLAQRIVLELRDKVAKLSSEAPAGSLSGGAGIPSAAGHASEAVAALTVLGYTPSDAASVVAKLDSSLPTEELIRLSLKAMGSRL